MMEPNPLGLEKTNDKRSISARGLPCQVAVWDGMRVALVENDSRLGEVYLALTGDVHLVEAMATVLGGLGGGERGVHVEAYDVYGEVRLRMDYDEGVDMRIMELIDMLITLRLSVPGLCQLTLRLTPEEAEEFETVMEQGRG